MLDLTVRGSCSCGTCGYEEPDCTYYLSNLCKDEDGNKDPIYTSNGCSNCPKFRQLCGESCNYCPNPLTTLAPLPPTPTEFMTTTAGRPQNSEPGISMIE